MRQLLQMFVFDVRMSFKNFMGAYILIVPFVILLILRSFLPAVDSSTVKFAIVNEGPNAVPESVIDRLSSMGDISTYPTIEAMEKRMNAVGVVDGLYWDPTAEQYVSVLEKTTEDNTVFSYAARYIRQIFLNEKYPDSQRITEFSYGVPEELSDRTAISPVATMGGSIFMVFLILVTAFLLGIAIVDDKDQGTILALRTSPVTTGEYYLGRSIFPFIVNLLYAVVALFALGLWGVNVLHVLVAIAAAFGTTLVFGLFIGGVGNNEVEAIGIGKVSSMVIILSILGATLLPDAWHWTVMWSPVYWTYDVLEEIFTQTASWSSVIWKSAVSLALAGLYFLLLRKKIVAGLT